MADDRTALVLSAGGLYCAWQAGAYKALAQVMRPDLVVGASAGALNGWLIAGGCSPELLIERWLDPAYSNVLHLLPKPGWRKGYFDPAPMRARTEKIAAEFRPQLPFGLTVVQLPRFRNVLVQHPHVTARHLEATCAIPFVLPAVTIDGRRYVDGGLIDKVPLRAAIGMGANRIIALDCLPPLDLWWIRLGGDAARFFRARKPLPTGVAITTIKPSEPLGNTNSAVFWKRENIERWIALGFAMQLPRWRTWKAWP